MTHSVNRPLIERHFESLTRGVGVLLGPHILSPPVGVVSCAFHSEGWRPEAFFLHSTLSPSGFLLLLMSVLPAKSSSFQEDRCSLSGRSRVVKSQTPFLFLIHTTTTPPHPLRVIGVDISATPLILSDHVSRKNLEHQRAAVLNRQILARFTPGLA